MKSSPGPATPTSETARVFDVRRFCVHDGEGIRTTVFFKGCPLKCAWCQNPEGIAFDRKPVRFKSRCINCGACAASAKNGGAVRAGGEININPEANEDWDALIDACPSAALRWDSREVTLDELLRELLRDAPFYAHGGGVTLSGGDPLAQCAFARALLLRLRENKIDTALETELFANYEDALSALELADTIFADIKLFDGALHKKYTGVGNALILDNIRKLLSGGLRERVIIRVPLIPTVTATVENISAIAGFISGIYPAVRCELLNYNPLAASKYPLVGRKYCFEADFPLFTASEMDAFYSAARRGGVKNLIREA